MTQESPIPASAIAAYSANAWLVADGEGALIMLGPQMQPFFGYTPEELLGQSLELLIPERLRGSHAEQRRQYYAQPQMRPMGFGLDLVGRRKDGSEFPVEISLSPIRSDQDGLTYILAIVRDVTERKRLELERNSLTVELETQQERQRIGMDLHDGIMQEVYAAGLGLELALEDFDERPTEAKQRVERVIGDLHEVIRNIRSYIFDLRPRQFSGDLAFALRNLAREFQRNSQIVTTTELPDEIDGIDAEQGIALYHIAHEALSNIHKHARARTACIAGHQSEDGLYLEIRDDGDGFDASRSLPEQHRGLRNMASRAHLIGAVLEVQSSPGTGTTISVRLSSTA